MRKDYNNDYELGFKHGYKDTLQENKSSEIEFKFEVGKVYYGTYSSGAIARFEIIKRTDKFITAKKGDKIKRYKISLSWNGQEEEFFVPTSQILINARNTFESKEKYLKWIRQNGYSNVDYDSEF